MSAGPTLTYKFTQQGIDDLQSRIKDLHSEFQKGQITYKQYHTEIKEATQQGRAATQEFSQMKGAIAATNPELLQYTRTMSTFGSVANTVLGITNAINLAQLAGMGVDKQVSDDRVQLASVTNQAAKDLAAFGPNSAQYQTDLNEKDALTNKLAYDQNQLAWHSIQTGVTLVASSIAIAGSISQSVVAFKALNEMMDTGRLAGFSAALRGTAGSALLLGGALLVVGATALIAGTTLGEALNSNKDAVSEFRKELDDAFGDNPFTNYIILPLAAAIDDLNGAKADWHSDVVAMQNDWIDLSNNVAASINTFIDARNAIASLFHLPQMKELPYGQMVSATTTSTSGTASASVGGSNPDADKINSLLVTGTMLSSQQLSQQQQTGNYTQQILGAQIGTNNAISSGQSAINTAIGSLNSANATGQSAINTAIGSLNSAISSGATETNSILTNIFSAGQAASQIAQQTLQTQQQQTDAINAYKASIIDNTNKIAELQKLPQSQLIATHYDSDTGQPIYDSTASTDAANKIAQLQQQNAQAAAIIASGPTISGGLDNMAVGLNPVLNSLGLDPTTGIGSVVSGALGDYGTIGGAGINAAQIAEFVQTHNYGVFTSAAIADNTVTTPSKQDQIQKLQDAWKRMGLSGYTAADASKALGYGGGASSGSANYNPADKTFGGLPGQYGQPASTSVFDPNTSYMTAATGFEGTISGPTHFLAGEAGPEKISIQPLSNGKGKEGNSVYITNNFEGSLLSQNDMKNTVMKILKDELRSAGF